MGRTGTVELHLIASDHCSSIVRLSAAIFRQSPFKPPFGKLVQSPRTQVTGFVADGF